MAPRSGRIALGLAILSIVAVAAAAGAAVDVGDKAPAFRLPDADGKGTIALSDYTDKPTLLVFWASWCPHCQRELPVVQKVYKDLKPKGANVVGVSVDENVGEARALLKKQGITFPNAFAGTDTGMNTARAYGVRGIPAVFFIDKRGTITAKYAGETDESDLRREFAKLGVK